MNTNTIGKREGAEKINPDLQYLLAQINAHSKNYPAFKGSGVNPLKWIESLLDTEKYGDNSLVPTAWSIIGGLDALKAVIQNNDSPQKKELRKALSDALYSNLYDEESVYNKDDSSDIYTKIESDLLAAIDKNREEVKNIRIAEIKEDFFYDNWSYKLEYPYTHINKINIDQNGTFTITMKLRKLKELSEMMNKDALDSFINGLVTALGNAGNISDVQCVKSSTLSFKYLAPLLEKMENLQQISIISDSWFSFDGNEGLYSWDIDFNHFPNPENFTNLNIKFFPQWKVLNPKSIANFSNLKKISLSWNPQWIALIMKELSHLSHLEEITVDPSEIMRTVDPSEIMSITAWDLQKIFEHNRNLKMLSMKIESDSQYYYPYFWYYHSGFEDIMLTDLRREISTLDSSLPICLLPHRIDHSREDKEGIRCGNYGRRRIDVPLITF